MTITRQEQAAGTRLRILDAAVEVLVDVGYAGASTLQIQQRAGLSRGGLLHQFGSRDELLVAAVDHLTTMHVAALTMPRVWPAEPGERIDAAVDAMWEQYRQPFFWASLELWFASRHNPEVARGLGPHERRLNGLVKRSVEAFFGPELASHVAFSDAVHLLLSSMRGVGVSYALQPSRDPGRDPHVRIWKDLARRLLLEGVEQPPKV
ncbi:MAG TPA: TetR/AcrR family transcriptional regulator [Nocardioidaceae bacterium]|nr:TetR/AcrR family transcriptional regulator [Nocardioidaceae bacterium]